METAELIAQLKDLSKTGDTGNAFRETAVYCTAVVLT